VLVVNERHAVPPPQSDPINAAHALVRLSEAYAAKAENVVLDVLEGRPVVAEQHYPAAELRWGDDHWRAYYHCHRAADRPFDEHGHFHIFVRAAEGDTKEAFAHLAALSMDTQGQPVRWFLVNHWVTAGIFADRAKLLSMAERADRDGEVDAKAPQAAQWLQAMVGLYRDAIARLLEERDRRLQVLSNDASAAALREDRDLYTLCDSPIDLLATLRGVLGGV